MKKLFGNKIFIFILGGLIFSSIGVGATTLYHSYQITYKSGNVENALNELYDETNLKQEIEQLKGKVLWENSSPTSKFSAQTIQLSSDDYDELGLYYDLSAGSKMIQYVRFPKGYGTYIDTAPNVVINNALQTAAARKLIYVDDLTYSVTQCYGKNDNSTSYFAENIWLVPIKIVGYKY